ncbi:monothiol bacilliredoxin BrxC family protein [Alkaliphilus peptidifermentans]|uniref:Bacillithiol system protein YtxJ n=1 Tax=Alkaliphilus peptidifermentans DSM 18978 TaxID=1120976 RepID=A0A1G5K4Y5_9FIRM|nr:monothiol bacilliredoxin BrxC family protein [Alkaliphilus peptidifermentans]SCY95110.1 bacillithiol system protein YtxJ [Alkaliphilus peptidifermentans DSM 18978]
MAKKVKKIADITELEKIIKRSNKKPVFIFKHDDKLQDSEDAYQEYINFIEDTEDDIVFTVIYVREEVEVSEAVEELLEVTHDVPQLILVMDEEVVWDDIKDNINFDNLIEVINEFIMV